MAKPRKGDALTYQEQEIATLLAGRTYRMIAEKLDMNPRTIRWHVANMCVKMDAGDKFELIAVLRDKHIIE